MVEHFRLGFSNRTLGYHLPDKNRVAGAAQRGRLQELGILRESGHEHFRGSLVIPIFNLNGEVLQMYGRKITAEPAAGNARSPVPAGSASRGVERSGAGGLEGNHPVRSVDRCADLLVRGLPQRDHQLRGERLHRGAPGGVPEARHADEFTSLTTATRPERKPPPSTPKS